MKQTQRVLAVALVATALCADRVASAAPELRPQVSVASRFASRLTSGFRRTVSAVRIYQARQDTIKLPPLVVSRTLDVAARDLHQQFTPFQFRLPPPLI